MTELNPDKVYETCQQIQNTNYPGKNELMAALKTIIAKLTVAKSVEEALFKAVADNSSSEISQGISYYTTHSDEPQASDIVAGLRRVLLSESIKSIKSSNMRNKAETLKRLEAQYNEAEAALTKSEIQYESDPMFDEMREAIRDGPGYRYRKKVQNDFVDAFEKRAGGPTPVQKSDLEIEHEKARAAVAVWGDKAVEAIDKQYAEQEEQAAFNALPDVMKKSVELLKNATASELKGLYQNESELAKATNAPDAPVVDTGSWNADEAVQHMLENAGAVGNDNSKVNWAQFGKGFLYRDESQPVDDVDSYKLPVCDVVDGVIHVNRDALASASGRLNQLKGVSPIEQSEIKRNLRGFYDQLNLPYPDSIKKSGFVGRRQN